MAIVLLELYSLVPVSEELISPFLFSQQQITFQVWLDYAAKIGAVCVLILALRNSCEEYYRYLDVFLWLMVGYLIDYFVLYNEPIGHAVILGHKIYISYTLFMIILGGYIVFKSWKI